MVKIVCQPCGGRAEWPCDDPYFVHNTVKNSDGTVGDCPYKSLTSHHSYLWSTKVPDQHFVVFYGGTHGAVTKYFCVPPKFCTAKYTIHIHAVVWQEIADVSCPPADELVLELSCADQASPEFITVRTRKLRFCQTFDPEMRELMWRVSGLSSYDYEEVNFRYVRDLCEDLFPAEVEYSEATCYKRDIYRAKGAGRLERTLRKQQREKEMEEMKQMEEMEEMKQVKESKSRKK